MACNSLKILNAAVKMLLITGAFALLSACGPTAKKWEQEKQIHVYGVAFRQLPPEPVYNRLRWVHLPEILPSRELPEADSPQIYPVFHLQLKNGNLEETAIILAATARYSSYCASSIARQKVNINLLGTIDELGSEIARRSGIHVVVDHVNKQVRFLAKSAENAGIDGEAVEPRFLEDEVLNQS